MPDLDTRAARERARYRLYPGRHRTSIRNRIHATLFPFGHTVPVPGVGPILAYTIAAEIGDIDRFASAKRLVGYTGLCPRVYRSGETDRRGKLAKTGPKYLRWALVEAAVHAARHPRYRTRYERTKRRLGKQRGSGVAQVELAREPATAIWYMLTRQEPFRAAGPRCGPVA